MTRALATLLLLAGCGDADATGGGSSQSTSAQTSSGGGLGGEGSGAGSSASQSSSSGTGSCPSCAEPADFATPASVNLVEASGLAMSELHAGVLYAHNDSGDSARFFAIGANGSDQGTFDVTGASAVDWEDMARGPCQTGTGSCLYFGDIGDNPMSRTSYTIYQVPEPATLGAGTHSVAATAFPFVYPDGSYNAEALMVHPTTRSLFILTKNANVTKLFELPAPLDSARTTTATYRTDVPIADLVPLVTAADFRPDGGAVLVRTYTSIWFFPVASGQSVSEALALTPCALPSAGESQGETVAWALDGSAYFTISEGAGEVISRVGCP